MTQQGRLVEYLAIAPVVPVLMIDDAAHAIPLAEALLAGGIGIVEVTLRTEAALPAIAAMIRAVPGMVVGAGTILTPTQYEQASAAGAQFIVAPGATVPLIAAARQGKIPFLPGAATPSEVLALRDAGYLHQKFFPAEPAGGIPMLKALAAPIPDVRFCPTGGITLTNAPDYLALGNIACVGGSWLTPAALMHAQNWSRISDLAAEASRLRLG
ncbi:MAG TPA: bifunctional 4-hydroxy-2-oxoglutarate aldolase/2-dehydro-3-deoxy-phosphogluconate aldolase [Acidiphilium sp.]|jgi:2-dehydro-3-deoxyphosphogluconate aldolase/(4S)-4-hydroxy-2-oxoglutarate aldolase|nr:MAG: keto-deoxy-phosphogluconate aldolase [Acidiphilium sp. 21-60-14]OYV90089.1 MAG: keto-deoxy-phosphogluconate aldolase [Acidiphilium sp. 37-60-79]OZB39434.1 MAG: keto-deoxy-phosphogluconate aldolase [Acidiphilium sp. 34-60-192]HQT88237.1 bifunctional 4-hydroxy-2-oxoglutarate aldolase/2-dehydro-3-deoxy-phosphogluconate aldolase [Acidiphilium sp.]HQU23443.1 bifunctional 4-hydroxy-2-oxoglutarate aldolase/2-dehydro-3-deoxy-phosphogluconate aldolase [Acidiphilium sp.]